MADELQVYPYRLHQPTIARAPDLVHAVTAAPFRLHQATVDYAHAPPELPDGEPPGPPGPDQHARPG